MEGNCGIPGNGGIPPGGFDCGGASCGIPPLDPLDGGGVAGNCGIPGNGGIPPFEPEGGLPGMFVDNPGIAF